MNRDDLKEAFARIRVPVRWAGQIRELEDGSKAWTCGGCSRPDVCAAAGRCARAADEDFALGYPTPRAVRS